MGGACGNTHSAQFTRREFSGISYGGGIPPLSYASALYDIILREYPLKLEDSCDGYNCNPTCPY